jgi:hypothetical protein
VLHLAVWMRGKIIIKARPGLLRRPTGLSGMLDIGAGAEGDLLARLASGHRRFPLAGSMQRKSALSELRNVAGRGHGLRACGFAVESEVRGEGSEPVDEADQKGAGAFLRHPI